jgi:hypothetical protein
MTTLTKLTLVMLEMLVMLVMQIIISSASSDDDDSDKLLFPVLVSVVISPYSSTLSCSTITSDSNKLGGISINLHIYRYFTVLHH